MAPLPEFFKATGLEAIETGTIDVTQTYRDFDDNWAAQTPLFPPAGELIAKMPDADRDRLRHILRAILPAAGDGSISYSAQVNAITAVVPQ